MLPQLPKLHKIRVLYVDDIDSSESSNVEEYESTSREYFWRAATPLCPAHSGSGAVPCANCLFELEFFPYFPPAMYALLSGKRYDLYLVDINADQDVALNRWDADKYEAEARQFRDKLWEWFRLRGGEFIDGEHHIIALVAKLSHKIRPYVVWMSAKYDPKRALESGGSNISQIATKDKDLKGILVTAVNSLKPQLLDKLSVPLPVKSIPFPGPGDYNLEYPAYLDFTQEHLRFTTGVEITDMGGRVLTAGLPPGELGASYTRELSGGLTHGLLLRYLLRGGRIVKNDRDKARPYNSRFFKDSEKEATRRLREELETRHPDLALLRNEFDRKVDSTGSETLWNRRRGLNVVSSVELAWQYLYHSIVHLYVHSHAAGDDLSEFAGKPLDNDAAAFDELGALLIAKDFSRKAADLGGDNLGRQCGDLELLWMPRVVGAVVDADSGSAPTAEDLQALREEPMSILNDMLKNTKKKERPYKIRFFRGWYLSDGLYELFRTIYEVEKGVRGVEDLKTAVFRLYADGVSLHEQF